MTNEPELANYLESLEASEWKRGVFKISSTEKLESNETYTWYGHFQCSIPTEKKNNKKTGDYSEGTREFGKELPNTFRIII